MKPIILTAFCFSLLTNSAQAQSGRDLQKQNPLAELRLSQALISDILRPYESNSPLHLPFGPRVTYSLSNISATELAKHLIGHPVLVGEHIDVSVDGKSITIIANIEAHKRILEIVALADNPGIANQSTRRQGNPEKPVILRWKTLDRSKSSGRLDFQWPPLTPR